MKKLMIGLMLAALPASAATAQSMNAESFYQRATALKKKGALAIFSRSEIRALMGEAKAAGTRAGELRREAVTAGRAGRFCPPETKQGMGSDEFMTRLEAIPAAERARINMTEATTRVLAAKYPCPR